MPKTKFSRTIIVSLVLAVSLVMSAQVSAVGESVTIQSFDTMTCQANALGAGVVVHVNGTDAVSIRFVLDNLTKATTSGFTAGIFPSGTYDFSLNIPANTIKGDDMSLVIDLLDGGNAVVATDSLSYLCGVVQPIPTLNVWGLGLLVLIFAGLARRRIRFTTA